ncbi:MAG: hotdog domain-containing protein, partial [Opitutales bacterium]
VKTSCRFKRPLHFEDEVEIRLSVREVRDRSIVYTFEFWKKENGEHVRAALGETVAACVRFDPNTHGMTPVVVPDVFREKIQPFADENRSEEDE